MKQSNLLPPSAVLTFHKYKSLLLHLFLAAVTILGCQFMLEFSCSTTYDAIWEHLWLLEIRYLVLNYLTIGVLWAFLLILTNRIWMANLLCTVLCGGIAIANYYVIAFHSMPLSFLLLRNFTTAMNVISSYQFTIDYAVVILLLAAVFVIGCVLLAQRFFREKVLPFRFALVRNLLLAVLSVCVIYFGYFSANPIKPAKTIAFLWSPAYYQYGYAGCTIETLHQLFNSVNMPEGYSQQALEEIEIPPVQTGSETPDIVLILNETFYDLRQVTQLETDVPYLKNIEAMDNLRSGYAVVPGAGGSTNSAEYELLTSNSLHLMPGVTPFNTLDLRDANSIVSHLSALGYSTLACHPDPSANYSRGMAFPLLGFQTVYFQEAFQNNTYYHNRGHETDSSLYENLIRWYEEAPADQPRFLYALTLQNHGNWDMNEPEHDLVHTSTDFGEKTRFVDEYLSCISLSDQAFKDLTDYFSQVDRPVIVCMLGDHAPNFAKDITDEAYSSDEKALRLRKVPLIIWANYELPQVELGTMSMNFVVPSLLQLADVTLSPYYSYILNLKKQVPVVASYGSYYDADGNLYTYDADEGSPYEALVNNYFFLEYNSLQDARMQHLFEPIH